MSRLPNDKNEWRPIGARLKRFRLFLSKKYAYLTQLIASAKKSKWILAIWKVSVVTFGIFLVVIAFILTMLISLTAFDGDK